MFAINAINYLDRFLAVAFGPIIKSEFNLRDADIGTLASAFLLVYTLAAVPAGLLADRVSRSRVVAAGVGVWSVASAASAFAGGFGALFASRAAVGVGEASYYPAGTALLSAYFPLRLRARIMSRWGAGQLLGMALAFALSALFVHLFGASLGWRAAFLVAGLPGLALAALMWLIPDQPLRGASRGATLPSSPAAHAGGSGTHTALALPSRPLERIGAVLRIRTIWLVIVLQGLLFLVVTPAVTFLPIYLRSNRGPFHLTPVDASLIAGAMIVVGGTCGVLLGGALADRLSRSAPGSRVLVAALGAGTGLPFFVIMLLSHSLVIFVVAGSLAVIALNLQAGPLTAAVQDATPAMLRATAVAVTLLLSHLLGDVWSPGVVGLLSTSLHERTGMALLFVGVPALAVSTVVGILGARIYAGEVRPDDKPPV
jgi:MFS family permease